MKFWQHDGIDGTFDAPLDQLVDQFRTSTWSTGNRDTAEAVRLFLTDTGGPISALWIDPADFHELCRRCDRNTTASTSSAGATS